MKKCALLLMCCLFMASCNKEVEEPTLDFTKDRELELLIEKDLVAMNTSIQTFFSQLSKKELILIKKQLDTGAILADVHRHFSSNHFHSLQLQISDNIKSLSYYKDQERFNKFIENVTQLAGSQYARLDKSDSTPCFNAWDLTMASIAAGAAICIGYSTPTIVGFSKCGAVAALAIAKAEITYRNCMEQYE